MNRAISMTLLLTLWGCGPHHVQATQIPVTKYECVNWVQTIALCDTLQECNQVCKEAAEKSK